MPASKEAGGDPDRPRPEPGAAHRSRVRVLDGAAFGVYEDADPPSRWPAVIGVLLAVAVLAVGLLVWRAVNADADLDIPAGEAAGDPATAASSGVLEAPTVADIRSLVPEGIDTCVSPDATPTDGPPRVALICPRTGVPETIVFVLYASLGDREAAFDEVVDGFGLVPGEGDCALGQNAVHDYIGVERVGRLACFSDGAIVDFVWTSDQAPLLVRARGQGGFADHYAVWNRMIERTDANFPLPPEQELLDQLPGAAPGDCRRDLELNVDAAGQAAVSCEGGDAEPEQVSSVQFADAASMSAWIQGRRSSAAGNVFGDDLDACAGGSRDTTSTTAAGPSTTGTSSPTSPTISASPTPDAAFTSYERDGGTGQALCFTAPGGDRVLVWTRNRSLIGSVAVADVPDGTTMRELLSWWERGGHRP